MGIKRLRDAFEKAEREKRAALVVYLCAGDPDLTITSELIVAAAESGADIVEIGVPFSDPIADGISIQRASERALASGTTLSGVLDAVAEARKRTDVGFVLFGYLNPILSYGEEALARDASKAGIDGLLVVDVPPEAAEPLLESLRNHDLAFVPLVAPTTTSARLAMAAKLADAFIYYVSLTGVTGAKSLNTSLVSSRLQTLRKSVQRPVAVGFGVKTPADVAHLARDADGVVVGSAFVDAVHEAYLTGNRVSAIAAARKMVEALRAATQRA